MAKGQKRLHLGAEIRPEDCEQMAYLAIVQRNHPLLYMRAASTSHVHKSGIRSVDHDASHKLRPTAEAELLERKR